ncbi:hypothetical protein KP79_PYT22649 [Mizuhopecten yessoensis]|uniref:Zinc finger PHD-type domain-containing protein n=1 Tax=Mizuhopecten yessoensis TaxID=6573 RepID=A0A210PMX3_MIZYE|nr:hypothetical protein KP79_PYT22649 [Mizuhopecten yessoensis]
MDHQEVFWTCIECHKKPASAASLSNQLGKVQVFVDTNYSILLRCENCNVCFHPVCVDFELEPVLTGEDTLVLCNYCAEHGKV